MRQILYIAHFFPPMGGAGVQRSVKFVKYLPEMGIQPTVLTGPGYCTGRWTPPDATLAREIPRSVQIVRAQWPMELDAAKFSPHVQRLRRDALIKGGERVGCCNPIDAIFVTMSPFQDAEVAAELSRRLGVPWIADLRDPWALDEFQVRRTFCHRLLERRKMQRALQTASLIIMNTPEAAARVRQTFTALTGTRIVSITNGYDAEDFREPAGAPCNNRFTIVHAGALHAEVGLQQCRRRWQYRLLGRLEPGVELLGRSHFFLIQALEQWLSEEPSLKRLVRLVFVGVPREVDRDLAQKSSAAEMIEFTGYQPHAESVRCIRNADLLFLPMHKVHDGSRASIVPGKAYEYMAAGRPILAAVPEGDAKDFLTRAGVGLCCETNDPEKMLRILKGQFENWLAETNSPKPIRSYIEQFERRRLTQRLASEIEILCDTCARKRGSSRKDNGNMITPPIVIVIPTCARSVLLERTLESLSGCELPSTLKRVIVVENGPKGRAEETVRKFTSRLPIEYFHVAKANKCHALNSALAPFTSEFVIFFDDDVRIHPQTLTAYAEAVPKRSTGYWGGQCFVDYEEEPPQWLKQYLPWSAKGWSEGDEEKELRNFSVLGFNWGAFAADIKSVGGFDERRGPGSGSTGDETIVQERLFARGIKAYYLPKGIVWHFVPRERCSPAWALNRIQQTAISAGIKFADAGWRIRWRKAVTMRLHLAKLTCAMWLAEASSKSDQAFHYDFKRRWLRGALHGLKVARINS